MSFNLYATRQVETENDYFLKNNDIWDTVYFNAFEVFCTSTYYDSAKKVFAAFAANLFIAALHVLSIMKYVTYQIPTMFS